MLGGPSNLQGRSDGAFQLQCKSHVATTAYSAGRIRPSGLQCKSLQGFSDLVQVVLGLSDLEKKLLHNNQPHFLTSMVRFRRKLDEQATDLVNFDDSDCDLPASMV